MHLRPDVLLLVPHGRDAFVCIATGVGTSMCIFLAPLAVGPDALGMAISQLNRLMDPVGTNFTCLQT